MARHWRTFDHPSDLGLTAAADSLEELFQALGEALAEQICPRRSVRPVERRRVELSAGPSAPTGGPKAGRVPVGPLEWLMVDFLSRLLHLFALEKFLIAAVRVARADESSLQAEVTGETYDPARHRLGPEVKAVTYHQLRVARQNRRWTARVLLDL
jgi:SHS2 domain-containing protein